MKKMIIILGILLMTGYSMSAQDNEYKSDTGLKLKETAGVWSISGKGGTIVLGSKENARDFMAAATFCFMKDSVKDTFNVGEQKFDVKTDDTGRYIIKVGLGAVKVRPVDTAYFGSVLEGKIILQKGKKIWKVITE